MIDDHLLHPSYPHLNLNIPASILGIPLNPNHWWINMENTDISFYLLMNHSDWIYHWQRSFQAIASGHLISLQCSIDYSNEQALMTSSQTLHQLWRLPLSFTPSNLQRSWRYLSTLYVVTTLCCKH
jgi:hypothetical protein